MSEYHPSENTIPPMWGKRKLGDLELPFTRFSGRELLEQKIFRSGRARAAHTGGFSRHPRSVTEILRDQFRFDFRKELDKWVKARWEAVRFAEKDPEGRYGISDCKVVDTMIPFFQETDRWTVALLFECTLMYTRPDLSAPRSRTVDMVMGFLLDLPARQCLGHEIMGILQKDTALPKGDDFMADEYFLPIIPRDRYPAFVDQMLFLYYPLEYNICPPPEFRPEAMAERMDFRIYERFFGGDLSDAEALVCFRRGTIPVLSEEDFSVEREPVARRDIYLNLALTGDPVRRENALTHELVHGLIHEPYALLQQLPLSDADPFGRDGYGEWQTDTADSPDPVIRRLERQAERLTAHLRMPAAEMKMRAEWRFSLYPDRYAPETAAAVIRHLADHFGTSLIQTRIHLSENGYPEAGGIGLFDPATGQAVPDHGCADGKWPEGQTYTVPYTAVFGLARRDEAFRKIFQSGKYTFAEHHVCLDTPRYIRRVPGGGRELTDYARRHMSECCLPFAVSGRNPYTLARDFLARKKKVPVTDKYVRYAPLGPTADERKFHFEEKKRWEALKAELTGDFGSCVRRIMEVKNISLEDMATRLYRSKQAISQTLNHRLPTFENAFSLVVELGCPYEVSVFLLGKLKYDVESGEDDLYRDILKAPGMSYELMNEILEECKRPRM